MNGPEFDITHNWTLKAQPEELTGIVLDSSLLHKWGRRIFMRSEILEQGDETGLGMRIRLHSKGWLPHTFLLVATIVDLEPHKWMTVQVEGYLTGMAT